PSLGGNQQQLSYLEFAPGSSRLTTKDKEALTTIANALKERPALRLDLTGRIDPAKDIDGLREEKLTHRIRELAGKSADDGDLSASEYDKYLGKVYSREKFKKPENFIGLDKSVPPAEMKKLILANTSVTDADLKQLADARAVSARRY